VSRTTHSEGLLGPRALTRATLLGLFALTLIGFFTFDYGEIDFLEAQLKMLGDLKTMFLEARLAHFTFAHSLKQMLVTVGLAFLTTVIGAVWAFFFGLLAARNLSNNIVAAIIKGLVAVIRAIPTVLWVLIFAVTAGLGATAAVLGMAFHSAGYLIKAYSESFEQMDPGVLEALKSGGSSWWQIVFQGILPSSWSYLIAWTFMRFELNFTVAVAMGVAAGAGGIGFEMFMANSMYFDLREIGFITYLILAVAATLEFSAERIKKKVIG